MTSIIAETVPGHNPAELCPRDGRGPRAFIRDRKPDGERAAVLAQGAVWQAMDAQPGAPAAPVIRADQGRNRALILRAVRPRH